MKDVRQCQSCCEDPLAQAGMTATMPTGPHTECGTIVMASDAGCGMMCSTGTPETVNMKAKEGETSMCQSPK